MPFPAPVFILCHFPSSAHSSLPFVTGLYILSLTQPNAPLVSCRPAPLQVLLPYIRTKLDKAYRRHAAAVHGGGHGVLGLVLRRYSEGGSTEVGRAEGRTQGWASKSNCMPHECK